MKDKTSNESTYITEAYYVSIRESGGWTLMFEVDKPNDQGHERHTFIFDTEEELLQWRKDNLKLIYSEILL